MKLNLPLFLMIMLITFSTNAQAQYKLTKDSILTINDLEYGYTITNIQSKADYERYEIRFFVRNAGCSKYISKNANTLFNGKEANSVADFSCINATGKRLTNKGKSLSASAWYLTINESMSKELAGKTIQVGYIFRKGENITGTEVILTPKGELPIVQVNAIQLREIMN